MKEALANTSLPLVEHSHLQYSLFNMDCVTPDDGVHAKAGRSEYIEVQSELNSLFFFF